jgi:pSer/pThr/pTyr-binding forkhead associated (FHA) protein
METENPPETISAAASLVADDGNSFPLGERNLVGRSDPVRGDVDVDLGGLADGGFVSRSHAEIWTDGGKWFIKDLGSSNGTFLVNGDEKTKVENEAELADGQRIAFGTAEVSFKLASEESGAEPAEGETE